jgi:hypothetical protein
MKIQTAAAALALMLVASTAIAAESALDTAQKITGKYLGQWTMYGVAAGQIVEKAAWTDVLEAGKATESNGRAFVEVTNVMTFLDGKTLTVAFIEGYTANADGTAGDRFYEIQGKTTLFKRLTDNDWAYQTTPDPGELWFLGFNPKDVLSASHVTTKTTTYEGDLETDHVTRLTTIQWKDADGKIKSMQFVSMKGTHTRLDE